MGNTCSSEFFVTSNASISYFIPGQQNQLLGPGYDAAWRISIAVACFVVTDWCARAFLAYRNATRLPLAPVIFKFVGGGDRVRQLCIGIYTFLWIFLFIFQIRNQTKTTSTNERLLNTLRETFEGIPWPSVYFPPPPSLQSHCHSTPCQCFAAPPPPAH
jgi:hypothetical protein